MRCQLAPGHTDSHQAVIISGEEISYLFWDSPKPSPEVIQVETPIVPVETPIVPEVAPTTEIPEPVFVLGEIGKPWKNYGWMEGRKRDKRYLNNLYAAFDEGIHTCWGMSGHEVRPYPMLDDLERIIF